MNSKSTTCRTEQIDAFLHGELAEYQVAEFERHLDTCDQCDSELTRRTADASFWSDAHHFLNSADISVALCDTVGRLVETCGDGDNDPSSGFGDAMADLSFLDPTDDPNMLGRFGGYEISGVVGRGGMGIVLKGWDVSLSRFVAIKLLNSVYSCQSASRKRFAREAQAAAAVLHDNVIAIYGVDEWKKMPYLVMPYIKGESLQQRIDRSAPFTLEAILEISLQIARGLAAAHDQGLVHRDIKPANILMPASVSRVIITDFGLARTADDASLTRSGVLAGTPQYMSPEQATGDAVDGRTDLFCLGSVMYAMACGRPPFRAETPYGVLRKITDARHRPLSQVRDGTPAWFEKIIQRLLEKKPANRFQTAGELAEHLEDCLSHLRHPTTTLLPKLSPPVARSRRKLMVVAALTVAITLAIGAGLWESFTGLNRGDSARDGASAETTADAISRQTNPGPSRNLPDHLQWEFDDSDLDRLETDLRILLNETKTPSPANPTFTPE
ncbi:MAG: protein kinase [Planctomycetales bacterium]|nr:protein kinase [Planctomycetales bacterium]